MSEQNMSPRLREGIDAAKRGDKTTARRLLQQVLSTDGNNELALMWMASVVDPLEERRFYLERALRINPDNARAREALRRLGVTEPQTSTPLRTTRAGDAAPARRAVAAPNTNLYLIAAAVVAFVVIAVIVASAISSLQPTPTATAVGQNVQGTFTARVGLTQTPTARVSPAPTELPGVVVTLDAALLTPLPPTFTPTVTLTPSETPTPTATALPLGRFTMIYNDIDAGAELPSLFQGNSDGSGEIKLANDIMEGFGDLAYSAATGRIAFVHALEGDIERSRPQLFVAALDDPYEQNQITDSTASIVAAPAWSPTGDRIVFTANFNGGEEIWIVAADGNNLQQLTDTEGDSLRSFDPQFSPDGEQIIFASDMDSPGFTQVYIMNADGTDITRLTNLPSSSAPTFSPDGGKIAYVNNQQGDDDIYVMDADGQNPILLTPADEGARDYAPAFSPDGQWVYFASNRGGETRWYAADLQGNVQPITIAGRTPQNLSFITD